MRGFCVCALLHSKMRNPKILEIEQKLPAAGLTVDGLCQELGIHRATWQRWKRGKTYPPLDKWDRMLELVRPEGQAA